MYRREVSFSSGNGMSLTFKVVRSDFRRDRSGSETHESREISACAESGGGTGRFYM